MIFSLFPVRTFFPCDMIWKLLKWLLFTFQYWHNWPTSYYKFYKNKLVCVSTLKPGDMVLRILGSFVLARICLRINSWYKKYMYIYQTVHLEFCLLLREPTFQLYFFHKWGKLHFLVTKCHVLHHKDRNRFSDQYIQNSFRTDNKVYPKNTIVII